MKKLFIYLVILASFQTANSTILLSSANFRDGAAGALPNVLRLTYTIATPGHYMLTEDIAANTAIQPALPTGTIYINSDNVRLDLNGFVLSQPVKSGTNVGASVHGILVEKALNNITIENGTIYQTEGAGVMTFSTVTNLTIRNMTFNSCNKGDGATTAAITLIGNLTSGQEIRNCTIENCHVQDVTGTSEDVYGLYATNVDYLSIKDSSFQGILNTTASNSAYACYITQSEYPIIQNSNTRLTSAHTVASGFALVTCTGAIIKNSEASGCISTNDSSFGFYLSDSNNALVENCIGSNCVGSNQADAIGAGFWIESCFGNQFKSCTAYGNRVSVDGGNNGFAVGFGTDKIDDNTAGYVMSCLFKDCAAYGQFTTGTSTVTDAAGFILQGSRYCTLEDCTSFGNNGLKGNGIGIYFRTDTYPSSRCVVKNCKVFSNTSDTTTKAYGIRDTEPAPNNVFYENVILLTGDTFGSTSDSQSIVSTQIPAARKSDYNIEAPLDYLVSFTGANQKGFNYSIKPALF
jgi:hypothetical protein